MSHLSLVCLGVPTIELVSPFIMRFECLPSMQKKWLSAIANICIQLHLQMYLSRLDFFQLEPKSFYSAVWAPLQELIVSY